ncbi:hypothetical protein ACLB2K_045468 [Fragaria x ananassa]
MMAKIPKFKARPVNKKILEAPSLPAMSRSTPQPPAFQSWTSMMDCTEFQFLKLLLFVQFQRIISKNREGNSGFSGYRRLEHNNISGELVSLIYSLSLAMVLEVSGKTIAFRSYKSEMNGRMSRSLTDRIEGGALCVRL